VRDKLAETRTLAQMLGPELADRGERLCALLARYERETPAEVTWAAIELMTELNRWALIRLNAGGQLRTVLESRVPIGRGCEFA